MDTTPRPMVRVRQGIPQFPAHTVFHKWNEPYLLLFPIYTGCIMTLWLVLISCLSQDWWPGWMVTLLMWLATLTTVINPSPNLAQQSNFNGALIAVTFVQFRICSVLNQRHTLPISLILRSRCFNRFCLKHSAAVTLISDIFNHFYRKI